MLIAGIPVSFFSPSPQFAMICVPSRGVIWWLYQDPFATASGTPSGACSLNIINA